MKDWKTSAQGILSLFLTVGVALLAFPSVLPPKETAMLTVGVGVAKAVVGWLQKDAKPAVTSSVTIETVTPSAAIDAAAVKAATKV